MTPDQHTTLLITREHLLRAHVALHGLRLLDALSDHNTDFFAIHDVKVFRRQCGTLQVRLSAEVLKADI